MTTTLEPIAIIGVAFKLPQGAEDEASLWEILEKGKNVMTPWPESRANVDAFYKPEANLKNTLSSKGGHFVNDDPGAFDAPFFSITSQEAASMDPQQRWLLETSYRALENAGIPIEKAAGTDTSVFAASMSDDYMRILVKDPDEAPTTITTGISSAMLANRLSWYFDFKGPSVEINTACSSSMVAMDLACQSLRTGQASMSLVTGSNVLLSPEISVYMTNMNFLSPDSLCYSFDHRANGYARGEGVVVVVLKMLDDAIRDGDMIRAVIRATGTNQDGHTPGITQPSLTSQEELIRNVYRNCGLGFDSTRYVEAHGTGTQIGDLTEAKAIGRVFRSSRSSKDPLYVGSIKANIGHTEGASGLAGILKCIFILERGIIPPNALFQELNPKINAKANNIQIPTSCVPWPTKGLRRVSVNSFGFGGSNGHIVIDDAFHTLMARGLRGKHNTEADTTCYDLSGPLTMVTTDSISNVNRTSTNGITTNGLRKPAIPTSEVTTNGANHEEMRKANGATTNGVPEPGLKYQLLVWSAKDVVALQRMFHQYREYCEMRMDGHRSRLEQLAYTLDSRRSVMAWRFFAVLGREENLESNSFSAASCVRASRERGMVFVFTGQGAQYAAMGLDLIQYNVFRHTLALADDCLQSLGAKWSLFDKLLCEEDIHTPEISQPLCTVLQIALVELLRSFGIVPDVVVGHSSGEIASAYTTGTLSLESACKVAYYRGRLAQSLRASAPKPSAMMSVNLSECDVDKYMAKVAFESTVHIACVNSPLNVTLSGDDGVLDELKKHLDKDGIFTHKLKTGVAYHSPAMQQIAEEYRSLLGHLIPRDQDNTITMVSSVTGQRISSNAASDSQYWVDNLVSPVRFADALHYIAVEGPRRDNLRTMTDYVEIGPHGALRRPLTDTLEEAIPGTSFRYMSVLSRFDSPIKTTLDFIGEAFAHGYPVSIRAANTPNADKGDISCLVDTPGYPFDKSQIYWLESRLSEGWRLREDVPRSLLGTRSMDWNPLEPRWRKQLSIEEMPWVADHVVGENIFFPATGAIMMALGAVNEMSDKRQTLCGYNIKECNFISPIVIRPEQKTEVMIHLYPLRKPFEKAALRFDVRIFARIDSYWKECFKATCHIQYEDLSSEVDGGRESRTAAANLAHDYEHARLNCRKPIKEVEFYRWHSRQGLKYGKTFAITKDIHWDGNHVATGSVNVDSPDTAFEGVVHPAVLDAAFQVAYTGPSGGMSDALPTFIPHRMTNMWISAEGWQYPRTSEIRTLVKSKLKSRETGIEGTSDILSQDGSPLCHIESFELLPVMSNESMSQEKAKMVHTIHWKPQLSLLGPGQLRSCCGSTKFTEDQDAVVDYCVRLERRLQLVLRINATHLEREKQPMAPSYMSKYVSLMRKLLQQIPVSDIGESDATRLNDDLDKLMVERPAWRIFVEVARNFRSIVHGDAFAVDSLEAAAQEFEEELLNCTCDYRLESYLELAAHEIPNQKILELGAGAGNFTRNVLSVLQQVENKTKGIAFSEYVFTDAYSDNLNAAQKVFNEYKNRMTFKTLDLELDITHQGFPSGIYDLVIASDVLHKTKNLAHTLRNIHQILKPGGKLIFFELTSPESFVMNFAFGVLPKWWCGEEKTRTWGPTLTELGWDTLLKETGFSGNDLTIGDHPDDAVHHASIIVSTSQGLADGQTESFRALLVVDDNSDDQKSVASALESVLSHSLSFQSRVLSLSQFANEDLEPSDCVVYLADFSCSLLAELTEAEFNLVKSSLLRPKSLLWVSASTSGTPYAGAKDGLLRTLRAEFSAKRLVSLTFEGNYQDTIACADKISQVMNYAFIQGSSEFEYLVRDEKILIGRLAEEAEINLELTNSMNPEVVTEAWLPGPPLKLDILNRGQLETLCFNEDISYYTDLGPTEVEIEAKAWAVNFRDMFYALGRLDEGEFGSDCAGIVTRVGSKCMSVKPGDRVGMVTFGCMRTYVRSEEWAVAPIPDSVSFEEACAVMNPTYTAWHCLMEVARLRKGEKILIHSASGATGQLAIQLAQMVGAEVFATVGYDEKKQLLIDLYGIPADNIFYSRNTSFAKGIMRVTNGYGVDVVLNSLVGEGLMASWECIATYGRFIEIGKADIDANSALPMGRFVNNVAFAAVDMRQIMIYRKEIAEDLFQKTMEMAASGSVHYPKPLHVYDVSAVEDAFRYFQSGKNSGRIVIRINQSTVVQKHLFQRKNWTFEENATYLVAGGFGGVGRSILRWMASKGARNLLVLTRSGIASDAAIEVVEELSKQNTTVVAPACDVSSLSSLSATLEEYARAMPPIRGCINATMVLNDSIFEKMTHAQWDSTVRSKIHSSWNLHAMIPKLDFFILLSSISGIVGNPGQSNYAAGCTFQDALARYRSHHGQKAVSIDLGVMRTVGVVAESKSLQKHFEDSQAFAQIEEKEFLSLLDICCDPERKVVSSQITMGLVTPADLHAHSVEPLEIMRQPLYAHFSQARDASLNIDSANSFNPGDLFKQLETAEERITVVVQSLSSKLARALSIQPEDVDTDQPLHAFGVDSLVAVELRNWIAREFAADVAVFEIMGGRTIKAIGELVTKSSQIHLLHKDVHHDTGEAHKAKPDEGPV